MIESSLTNLLNISASVLTVSTVKAHINTTFNVWESLTALRGFGCFDWINLAGTYQYISNHRVNILDPLSGSTAESPNVTEFDLTDYRHWCYFT